jgi:hypothetical protein
VSVEFDPIKLGPRRRRVDPFLVGVLVVAIGLAVAVVKPWVPGAGSKPPGPSAGLAVAPPAPSTPIGSSPPAAVSPAPEPTPTPPPRWTDIAPVVDVHRQWGVEAVLDLPATTASQGRPTRYISFWSPVASGPDGPQSAYVARDDQSIVALGITFPSGEEVPEDARIWLVHAGNQLEWINARVVVGGIPSGAMLFVRPPVPGVTPSSWPGGHYRIDALVSGQIRRIYVQIPTRLGSVARPDLWVRTASGLVDAAESDPSSVKGGLFATVNGTGVPLDATPGALLDEAGEWLDVARGRGRSAGPTVATAYMPLATGLGVMLASHASLDSAVIRQLAPDATFGPGAIIIGRSGPQDRTPYVIFTPPLGGALPSGVYALAIGWRDELGRHTGTWYLELRPGPTPPPAGTGG